MTPEILWRKDRPGGCLAASGKFEALRTVCEERDGERERRQRAEEEVAELQGVARGWPREVLSSDVPGENRRKTTALT